MKEVAGHGRSAKPPDRALEDNERPGPLDAARKRPEGRRSRSRRNRATISAAQAEGIVFWFRFSTIGSRSSRCCRGWKRNCRERGMTGRHAGRRRRSLREPEGFLDAGVVSVYRRIDVLRLRRNLGHQRAIAIGLAYVEDCLSATRVVVMDGDGEDDPADVPRCSSDSKRRAIGRSCSRSDRGGRNRCIPHFLSVLQAAALLLTGKGVRVGNYHAIPRRRLSSLVVVAEMWNHYAAACFVRGSRTA